MSECIHGMCLVHHRVAYIDLDGVWVHQDGWPCDALAVEDDEFIEPYNAIIAECELIR